MTQVITKTIPVGWKTVRTAIDAHGYRFMSRQVSVENSPAQSIPKFLRALIFKDWQFYTTWSRPAPLRNRPLQPPSSLHRVHPVFFRVEPSLHRYVAQVVASGRYPSISAFCSSLVADYQMEFCRERFAQITGFTLDRGTVSETQPATYAMADA